ncbi:MAG: NAD(P)H-dependent oxidoreductase subunit E [Deltaproteobacteria bacterium CG03_land_8_20_14_0_80_45_14]|jgi:NADH-quinone oxidoreductase subunit E|nr:MAG: NAD(P)H-dependent oxidoreductase subunit E [Deltaproteobacteria bacterium CG03_land_8_20_14_0_80_45_14]
MEVSKIDSIIEQYGARESALLAILQDIQAKENYLPKDALEYVSQKMHIPLVRIFRIATFYNALSLKPRGLHKIDVCLGTACHVRGGSKILEKIERDLGVSVGETTKDNRFTLESVRCIGCCSLGPVAVVDGKVFGRLGQDKVSGLLKEFK